MIKKRLLLFFSICSVLVVTVLPFIACSSTPAPDPTGMTVGAITGKTNRGGTINWTTTRAGSTQIEWGTTAAYGTTEPEVVASVLEHTHTLAGLSPATTYYYRVKSVIPAETGGEVETLTSPGKSFTTSAAAEYIVGSTSQPSTDNVFKAKIGAGDAMQFSIIYEPLVWQRFDDVDGDGDGVTPALSDTWSWDATTLKWTFHIDSDAKWSDGEDVTSADVKFTLDYYIGSKLRQATDIRAVVAATNPVVAVDADTVTIELLNYHEPFVRYLGQIMIVPEHIWAPIKAAQEALAEPKKMEDYIPVKATYAADLVGSGPFKLVDRVKDSHVTYHARLDWWGGIPNIDIHSKEYFLSDEPQLIAIMAGDIHAIGNFNVPSAIPQLVSQTDKFRIFTMADNTTMSFYLNHRIEPFGEKAFRQALSLGIDRDALIRLGASTWGQIPPMLERDISLADVQANLEDVEWPGLADAYKDDDDLYDHDLRVAAANAMLDDIDLMSGIAIADGGTGTYRNYAGSLLEFTVWGVSSWTEHVTVADLIIRDLLELGVKITPNLVTSTELVDAAFRQKTEANINDVQCFLWGRPYPPEYDYFANQWQYTTEVKMNKRASVVGWRGTVAQAIGAKLTALQKLPSGNAERNTLIAESMAEWAEELPLIPLYNSINPGLYRIDKVSGMIEDNGLLAYGSTTPGVSVYNLVTIKMK